ncbi:MAG: ABC transporter substrate-binding protein [Janthinobacterium lividum]
MPTIRSAVAGLAFAATAMLGAPQAWAETTLMVHYPMPGFFKAVMDTVATKFMAENPDVKITFATPSPSYEDGLQLILREAGTTDLPDISFVGLNRLRLLSERGIVLDLAPLIAKEGDLEKLGFTDHILSLARWGDKQAGLAFATSNPIMYMNADLVRKAGGDPDHPPKTWDEVIALGGKIKALGDGNDGIDFRWQADDWMFSALLFGDGGTMLSSDEKKVTFDGPAGQAAFALVARMVKEGGMPVFTKPAGEQAFVAGKVGLEFQTTGALRNTIDNVGHKFELRTAPIPLLDPKDGHLPTGGNAVVILTHDQAKLDAAWRFAKFAAGPYGASVVVPGTGYVPNNALAATSPQYLGDFYASHPLYKAALGQMDRMIPWYSFPGANSVRVTQAIVDNLSRVVEGTATPDVALHDAADQVQKLLPRH